MKIREMLEREKYIDDTIDKLSGSVKAATSRVIGAPDKIIITYDSARQIATCLDWLQAIFKQNIDSFSVYDVSIKNLPDY